MVGSQDLPSWSLSQAGKTTLAQVVGQPKKAKALQRMTMALRAHSKSSIWIRRPAKAWQRMEDLRFEPEV
jgi:hypothetical protein